MPSLLHKNKLSIQNRGERLFKTNFDSSHLLISKMIHMDI